MFRLSLTFALLFCLLSCNKKIGGFQKSTREVFAQKTKISASKINLNSEIHIQTEDISNVHEELIASESLDLPIENDFRTYRTLTDQYEIRPTRNPKEVSAIKEESKTIKSDEVKEPIIVVKRNPVFNDSLKIGFVFLAIAIGMAFFPALLQLMVLFAVVSIVFLFIGLKKLFNRRAKMKQKELRKEKNQERKEKIIDVFKK